MDALTTNNSPISIKWYCTTAAQQQRTTRAHCNQSTGNMKKPVPSAILSRGCRCTTAAAVVVVVRAFILSRRCGYTDETAAAAARHLDGGGRARARLLEGGKTNTSICLFTLVVRRR